MKYKLNKISDYIDYGYNHLSLSNSMRFYTRMLNDYDYDNYHKISMMRNHHNGCISHSYILRGVHLHTLEGETTRRPRSFSFKFGFQDLDYHKQNQKYIKAKYK